jgi:hypothetical protein
MLSLSHLGPLLDCYPGRVDAASRVFVIAVPESFDHLLSRGAGARFFVLGESCRKKNRDQEGQSVQFHDGGYRFPGAKMSPGRPYRPR